MPQSRAEKLRKKREAEKRRQLRIKENPKLLAEEKIKNQVKYLNRKEKNQVKLILDKTDREKRLTRLKWRKASRKYREKNTNNDRLHNFLEENTPPSSPLHCENEDVRQDGRLSSGRRKANRNRRKLYRQLKIARDSLAKAKRETEKYKKRFNRLKTKTNHTVEGSSISPNTKVKKLIKGQNVNKEVKRRLLFGEVVKQQININYNNSRRNTEKQFLRKCFNGPQFRKYKLIQETKNLVCGYTSNVKYNKETKFKILKVKKQILNFLERDENSKLTPGKKDVITRNKTKKQIRYYNHNLKYLHKEFLKMSTYKVSYTTFCRFRPFWIKAPRINERDTCLCKTHSNMSMLVEKLFRLKIFNFSSPYILINQLCCNEIDQESKESCLLRTCNNCKNKIILYNEFHAEDTTSSYQWLTKKETRIIKGVSKSVQITRKERVECTVGELIDTLENSIHNFMSHCGKIRHQFKAIRFKKENMDEDEILIHIDFSENFSTKYTEEIQSVHFGGSRKQITLHTGVFYTKNKKPTSFCTISESLRHDPSGIWGHLTPVIQYVQDKFPQINKFHFLSDGPCTQHRNKKNFQALQTFLPTLISNIASSSWSFSESGHGKGAPDGVGGVLKRTADQLIAQGNDITDVDIFLNLLREHVKGVLIWRVTETEIDNMSEIIDTVTITPIQGTMKIHQVSCTYGPFSCDYRSLTCWQCIPGIKCPHFSILQKQPGKNKDVIYQQPEIRKSDEVQDQDQPNYVVDDWVVVIYELNLYPGKVVQINPSGVVVNAMVPVPNKKGWKWPAKADICIYPYEDVKRKLNPPTISGGKRSITFFDDFMK